MIAFAWTMLWIWPVVSIVLYQKLALPMALCVTIMGGYLILPSALGYDLPLLPILDKHTIPAFSALVLTSIALRKPEVRHLGLKGWIPRNPIAVSLLGMLIIGGIGTFLTNRDALVYGPRFIAGLQVFDIFSTLLATFVMLIPLFLGRRVLHSAEGQKTLLIVIVTSALIYTVPILWEIRMSPQLHTQIYGFFPHSFAQQFRAGGFRAVVFLNHGLAVSMFIALAALAALGLMRANANGTRKKWVYAVLWLGLVLSLSKSLGPLFIGILLGAIGLFMATRIQVLLAAVIAGAVLFYPMLRSQDLVPVDQIMSFVTSINAERAESLNFRIRNEEILLEKARERVLFGWGQWGRNRIYDARSGSDISIVDGVWVGLMGVGGWFSYVPTFGLLVFPIIALFFKARDQIDKICVALVLMLAAKLVNAIPNAGLDPLAWIIAGSLWGRLEAGSQPVIDDSPTVVNKQIKGKVSYAREAALAMPQDPVQQSGTLLQDNDKRERYTRFASLQKRRNP